MNRVDPSGCFWEEIGSFFSRNTLSVVQIAIGAVLCATGVGAGIGTSLIIGGAVGIATNELLSPQIGSFVGGATSISNGVGAVKTGASLMGFGLPGQIFGGILMTVGLITAAFGANECINAATDINFIATMFDLSDSAYYKTYCGLNIVSGIGQFAGKLYMNSSVGQAAKAASDSRMVEVTRYGRPGLKAGDWVVKGKNTKWNYIKSFKWDRMNPSNKPAGMGSGETFTVPNGTIKWPKGMGIDGWIKDLFGQRKYMP